MTATLKAGTKGNEARRLKELLLMRGYAVSVDGVFGTKTEEVLRMFQSDNLDRRGSPLSVDGIAGPETWRSLENFPTGALWKDNKSWGVKELQRLLNMNGYKITIDGNFGLQTRRAVRAFQARTVDSHGEPLVVDGIVGPITWWSLRHPKLSSETISVVDYRMMPPEQAGGSHRGRTALEVAIGELRAGAQEIGGNNSGHWVLKYLDDRAPEGNPWCAAFISWCFAQDRGPMPFRYTLSARTILGALKRKGWAHPPRNGYVPEPGDIVVWWRELFSEWQGHVGFVHQFRDGRLYTIEGNKSTSVQGFSYVFSRMEKLLGFCHIPDQND